MPTITVDGKVYEARGDENLLKSLLSLGLDLPYFCWHPALGSVGACRQCAVIQYRDENDHQGRLVMACMTPVTEGLRIGLEASDAKEFRATVIEFLMTNHPHDCPVCEEGGECHLQDMTVMTGHTDRSYRGLKRTHRNQYLGPFISHEMNRCIACYRCVRFYQDYAGGHDLQVFASRNNVYFGRFEDGVLDNEFSGNLVEVCPTGVFTDKTFSAHYTRKWDLQAAPSICVHCGLGCNTSPGERYGTLRRIVNRYHGDVNGYFLCDRGRFGYGFVNGANRIRTPTLKGQPIAKEAAAAHLAELSSGRVLGIGSPRASLEANFALREWVGAENFFAGFDDTEYDILATIAAILQDWPVRTPSLRDMEQADAVLVLGEDVTNTAPRLALSLRQAIRNGAWRIADRLKIPRWQDAGVREAAQHERSPLFIASPTSTRLDDVAQETLRCPPADVARLGFAIAHALDDSAPAVEDLSDEQAHLAATIAEYLRTAQRPLVVSGIGCRSLAVIQAAANIARALANRRQQPGDLSFAVPECNSLGLALLEGRRLSEAFLAAEKGLVDAAIVLENDLYRRADRKAVDRFLSAAGRVAVIDHTWHDTAAKAELVLAGSTFAETEGTLVSAEGRAQRFFSVLVPEGQIQDSWRWLSEPGAPARNIDTWTEGCARALAVFAPIAEAAPAAGFRIDGRRVARQPHRYSGRTAMVANVAIHEPKPPQDRDSALAFSMEGAANTEAPPALRPFSWAPGWNSGPQSVNKFQDEVGGHLRGGDPGVHLFEPKTNAVGRWFSQIPPAFRPEPRWPAVTRYHIFGSEELSALSEPLGERMPKPYVALHPADAEVLGVRDTLEVALDEESLLLPVSLDESLPRGVVGVPAGLPGFFRGPCPERITIRKAMAPIAPGGAP